MIGGHDITFRMTSSEQVMEGAIRLVRACWQDAVVENAETGELLPDYLGFRELPQELLIYKNAAAREAWAASGATMENANLMLHLLRESDSMTIVVDDPGSPEMSALIGAIREHVYQDIFWMRADAA